MTSQKGSIKEYADGWISERKGTGVPGFLKAAYIVIGLGSVGYLLYFMNGEVGHATRGLLVQQLNLSTRSADLLMYGVAALALIGLAGLAAFAFRKPDDH